MRREKNRYRKTENVKVVLKVLQFFAHHLNDTLPFKGAVSII